MSTLVNRYRVRCTTEAAYVHAWATTAPTVCPNNSGHTIDASATAVVQTRDALSLIVDPVMEPVVPGASAVVANDRPAIEVATDVTGYGAIQAVWPHQQNDAAHVDLVLSFVLKEAGTGTTVRMAARIKGDGAGDDSSGSWSDTAELDVTVSHTTVGEVFRASLTLDADAFDEDDAIALQVGRAGAHANDNCSVAIQLIGVKAEAH